MDEVRIERAMNRMIGALERIESAAQAAPKAGSRQGEDALRREVSDALAELDTLIAGLAR
ncbi:MAG: hypothetical protein JNJ92_10140 [Altererythrobacter sp.]|nr:hypothetical protein [Altererythrobacter sp.]